LKKARLFVSIALISSIVSSHSHAGWVDDWVDQKSGSAPGYFKGQKRGYVSGGGFSARWQTGSDNLFSVEAPKFKVGCGGIDLSAGSMSYLDFDHLTAKMRKILANAPAAAFDMALQTLCQPCVQTIKSMASLADQFNNLQINDCQASKALVATITNGTLSDSDEQAKGGMAAMNTAVTGGASTWWQGVSEAAGTVSDNSWGAFQTWRKTNTPTPTATKPTNTNIDTMSCSAVLQEFIPESPGQRISLLNASGVGNRGLSQDYIDMLRGAVGDIEFINADGKIKVAAISPCANQNESAVGPTPPRRMTYSALGPVLPCTPIPDTNADLNMYVSTKMQLIVSKMKSKTVKLTASDIAFLDSSPLGLALTLRTAVGTSSENATIANMSELTAKAYAYYMMADLFAVGNSTVYALSDAFKTAMVDKKGCDISTLQPNSQTEITTFLQRIHEKRVVAQSEYQASIQEAQAVQIYLKSIVDTQNMLYDKIAKDFGASVAGRIVKR
jgi:conjugative transfer pilus assembly protein TraH